jgi:hypothetical protein
LNVNKHIMNSLVIREMQVKTTRKFNFMLLRLTNAKMSDEQLLQC